MSEHRTPLKRSARPRDGRRVSGRLLSPRLRAVLLGIGALNVAVGLLFLFGPELGLTPWPSPISPVLTRFIGAIIAANGVGAWLVARQGTWEGARALFAVALVYGAIVLIALPAQLLIADVDRALWIYVAVDATFLGPIAYVYWSHERAGSDRHGR